MTVAEKLMSQAVTQSERDLLQNWFEEREDPFSARQRACYRQCTRLSVWYSRADGLLETVLFYTCPSFPGF